MTAEYEVFGLSLPRDLRASEQLGAAYQWLHAFALGEDPPFFAEVGEARDLDEEPDVFLAEIVWWESQALAGLRLQSTSDDEWALLGGVPHKAEDRAKVAEGAAADEADVRHSIYNLVTLALAFPGMRRELARVAVEAFVAGRRQRGRGAYADPYIELGRANKKALVHATARSIEERQSALVDRDRKVCAALLAQREAHRHKRTGEYAKHYSYTRASKEVASDGGFGLTDRRIREIGQPVKW